MKLLTFFALFVISTNLFAATSYSFKCVATSDGACNINSSNARPMTEVQAGVFGGTEGEFNMYYVPAEGSSYLYIYKGQNEMAQSEGKYLAVPTTNGYAGVILVEGLLQELNTFIQPSI